MESIDCFLTNYIHSENCQTLHHVTKLLRPRSDTPKFEVNRENCGFTGM